MSLPLHLQSDRNWEEDFERGGMYTNDCVKCSMDFVGMKHRRVCKKCYEESKP